MKKILVILVFVLASCGADAPKNGVVVDKRYVAAHTDHWTEQICTMYNKNMTCQIWIPQQRSEYVPEKYQLKLQSDDGKHEGWRTVDPKTYEICDSGWRYDKGSCNP